MGFPNTEAAVSIEPGFCGVFLFTAKKFAEEPARTSSFVDFIAEGFEFLYCFSLGGLVWIGNIAVE